MENGKTLRAGVVGCGLVSRGYHVPSLKAIPGVDLRAVCDFNKETAEKIAQKFKVPATYERAEDMLEKEELDIVHVLTPPDTHVDVAGLCMDAGCDVLIEKPFTYKVEEADRAIAKAKETGKRFSVIHNDLFHGPAMQFRKRIANGEVGELSTISFMSSNRDQSFVPSDWYFDTYGGRMGETLPHALYPLVEFAEDLEVVYCNVGKLGHCITPDFYKKDYRWDQLQAELTSKEKNLVANISYGFNGAMPTVIVANGTKGSLMLTGHSEITKLSTRKRPNPKKEISAWVGQFNAKVKKKLKRGQSKGRSVQETSHYTQIKRFVEAVRNGNEFDVTPNKARSVVRLWQEITGSYESV